VWSDLWAGQIVGRVSEGMSQEEFAKVYPKEEARTYRTQGNEEWLTFDDEQEGVRSLLTFHVKDKKIIGWMFNDRKEVVKEYLSEFCSQGLVASPIYQGIKQVLFICLWMFFYP